MKEFQDLKNLAPKAPPPSESDPSLASFAALQRACTPWDSPIRKESFDSNTLRRQRDGLEKNANFLVTR
jgi:hypothetical protein